MASRLAGAYTPPLLVTLFSRCRWLPLSQQSGGWRADARWGACRPSGGWRRPPPRGCAPDEAISQLGPCAFPSSECPTPSLKAYTTERNGSRRSSRNKAAPLQPFPRSWAARQPARRSRPPQSSPPRNSPTPPIGFTFGRTPRRPADGLTFSPAFPLFSPSPNSLSERVSSCPLVPPLPRPHRPP